MVKKAGKNLRQGSGVRSYCLIACKRGGWSGGMDALRRVRFDFTCRNQPKTHFRLVASASTGVIWYRRGT